MKIGINYKIENRQILDLIATEAKKHGFELDDKQPDVIFSIGGDGTFLRTVHKYIDVLDKVMFVGINKGSLGFFYDFFEEEIPEIMNKLADGSFRYPLLKGDVEFENSKQTIFALNEIRVENPFHTIISDVLINDEKLESCRGNGLIVSSALGSSAYNKSLGGALIDHDLKVLELTEVAGIQSNIKRSLGSSLVINGDKNISISGNLNDSIVVFDHLNIQNAGLLKKIDICYSNKIVKIISSDKRSYVDRIRKSFVL